MCMSRSKRSQEDEESTSKTTVTEKPIIVESSKSKCPDDNKPCVWPNSTTHCSSGNGLCCFKDSEHNRFCKCESNRTGKFCESVKLTEYEYSHTKSQGTQAIAAFSALIGVIVIILFLALVVLQIKYYRERKKRRHGDHEQSKISRPDASVKRSKKVLITQPGYSWRESVRRTGSKAANKFRNTLSNSVPDDLFGVGVKLAIIGGFKPPEHQSTVGKVGVKAPTTDRCFSAGPELGDRQIICDQEDNANANNEPIPLQIPAAAAAAAAATEDTVM